MRAPLFAIALTLTVQTASAASLTDLSFMSGCWTTLPDAPETMRECHTAPYAGLMQGSSQTVKGGATTFWEFVVIEQKGDVITYSPYLKGKNTVSFTAVTLDKAQVVFENLDHDFPKRIIYRRTAPDRLEARVEGTRPDDPNNQTWILKPQGF